MSGSFYARYVPPIKSASSLPDGTTINGQKRRHEEPSKQDQGKRKKQKQDQRPTLEVQAQGSPSSRNVANGSKVNKSHGSPEPPPTNVLAKYSVTQHAESHGTNGNGIVHRKTRPYIRTTEENESQADHEPDVGFVGDSTMSEDVEGNEAESGDDTSALNSKHASLMSKFGRSRAKALKAAPIPEKSPQVEELHGLEPIPQPSPAPSTLPDKPAYSTLPSWLANPTRVSQSDRRKFDDLHLDARVLKNLKTRGMNEAFSVQSAVLPLLIDGPDRYNGDICISAATGSGKTLAYALPMIQSLMNYATTNLRGLIVVPTRELVKQAREVCELCAAGTRLKVASAVGNKSLKEEEDLLVEHFQEFKMQDQVENAMTLQNWQDLDLQDLVTKSRRKLQPGFVRSHRSKIDILICTPGRLVEHIRSTEGFSLNHLEWLVVDEADRLMNESFQEWIEVVIPALDNRNPIDQELTNKILQDMKMPKPVEPLQKVILSATFSRDISKLNSLKLRNPKLVMIGNESVGSEAPGLLSLPSTLSEFAIPVGDGSEKPLYLLELMKTELQKATHGPAPISDDGRILDSDDEASSDESSSSTSSDPRTRSSAKCLIFTGSTESAERLHRLLTLLDPHLAEKVSTLTKISASSSRRVLNLLRHGKISFVIATDRASRGLDIPELDHVISYDVPTSVTSYVHRVGRTARAGLTGQAWTLIAHREARWFWNEIDKGTGETSISRQQRIQRVNLQLPQSDDEKTQYESALKTLGDAVWDKKVT